MRKCSSTILSAACTFRPYKSTPVLKLFRTFTGKMTRGLSLRMVFSLLFQDTLLIPCVLFTQKPFFVRCWDALRSFFKGAIYVVGIFYLRVGCLWSCSCSQKNEILY